MNRWISVKLPTAYMVLPHCTSWRTVSVVPVAASFGVPVAGVDDTGPVCAAVLAVALGGRGAGHRGELKGAASGRRNARDHRIAQAVRFT